MNIKDAYSQDYVTARSRFRKLSRLLTDSLSAFPVLKPDDDLSIDVAEFGDPHARRKLVVSSGLHGVEGFVGSAIQAALLERMIHHGLKFPGCSLVLIHAINPYGFKHFRRVNEDNIDLNRNFLDDFEQTPEASEYARFEKLLNPDDTVGDYDMFVLKAYLYICRYGLRPLRDAIASGQYEFPRGLFFGGNSAAASTSHVNDIFMNLRSGGARLFHIDIHSGLGRYADYRLLWSGGEAGSLPDRFKSAFDSRKLELIGGHDGMTGAISGTICDYLSGKIGDDYQHLGLEFGTYSNIRILKMLRIENAAHHFSGVSPEKNKMAKSGLLECFCPQDSKWRRAVLRSGLRVIEQAGDFIGSG